jgi:ribosome recycling factor
MSVLDDVKSKMTAVIEHYKGELKNIRTGRANPGMVESVTVQVYGNPTQIKKVASITVPESRVLLITPFDPSTTSAIAKGLQEANTGFTVVADGNAVRMMVPQMTEEIRKKMAKLCHEEKEKAKVSIRNIRRDGNEAVRKLKSAGEIAEDVMKKTEKNIQDLTDKSCKEIDDLADKKEKEISTI